MITPFKPQLRVNIPAPTSRPSSSSSTSSTATHWSAASSTSVEFSTRSLLRYTLAMLPDDVLSPSSWRSHGFTNYASPMTLSYEVEETNVTVQVTAYANEQYVVRLLGQQGYDDEEKSPLVAISVLGNESDGQRYDVPAWKVRETLLERIEWDKHLE
jgi:hypothetical protein